MPEKAVAITKEYFGFCPGCNRLTQWDLADLKDGIFAECEHCRWLFPADITPGAVPTGLLGSDGKGV
jgi:hypothetical protein